ncbi:MAG: hypothetical protein V4585_11110 [Bacteroidota bacterium]|jgi:hypothetical protein
MKKYNFLVAMMLILGLGSCKQQYDYLSLRDAVPTDVITVDNAVYYERIPFVTTSQSAGGNIEIILKLADGSPNTIKEITRVNASSTNRAINATSVQTTTGLYNTAVIAGNGKSVSFKTTIAEYLKKKALTTLQATTTGPYDLQFYFLVTLDNGQTIIPLETRVRPLL